MSRWRTCHYSCPLAAIICAPVCLHHQHTLNGMHALSRNSWQGSECQVVRGARVALANAPRLRAVAFEIASKLLWQHCCRPAWLLHQLRTIGDPDNGRLPDW